MVGKFFNLLFIFLLFFIFCSCAKNPKVKITFPLNSEKYYIRFQKSVLFPYDSDKIDLEVQTNFQGGVSFVVSQGLFNILGVLQMTCSDEKDERLCKVTLNRDLFPLYTGEQFYFWFILETKNGAYFVPNMRILGEKFFDYLGRIYIQKREEIQK
ncbi:hypothetical protein HRbin19_00033 [bacterium HR19]|nr:hypothetical protein HRbin19_00033 [bacterium HR19]